MLVEVPEVLLPVVLPVVFLAVQMGILVIQGVQEVLSVPLVLLHLPVNLHYLPDLAKGWVPNVPVGGNTTRPPKSAGLVVAGVCPKVAVKSVWVLDASTLLA